MELDDFNCVVCYELCDDAMEAICCGQLFCERCVPHLQDCPTCRHSPMRTAPNQTIRRIVGKMNSPCPLCHTLHQRGNMKNHIKTCTNREYICAVEGCQFSGQKIEFFKHLTVAHERELLRKYSYSNESTLTAADCFRAAFMVLIIYVASRATKYYR